MIFGHGGRKNVYVPYHTVLDRDVALALIKTQAPEEEGHSIINRQV